MSAFFANLNFYAAKNVIEPLQSGGSTVESTVESTVITAELSAAKSAAEAAISLHSGLALYPCVLQDIVPFGAAALLPLTPIHSHAEQGNGYR